MRAIQDLRLWLQGAVFDGRQFFWAASALYGVFCWMFVARGYAPLDASTGAVLALSVLAFGEASVRFAQWCAVNDGHPHKTDWARWARWGRPIIAAHVAVVWLAVAASGAVPSFSAMLIAAAAVVFGLAQTLPGLRVHGKLANGLLLASVAIPCLVVAAAGHLGGL